MVSFWAIIGLAREEPSQRESANSLEPDLWVLTSVFLTLKRDPSSATP